MAINFVLKFITREHNFLCINNDNMVAYINVRCIGCLVFAHKQLCGFRSQTTDGLAFCINQMPLACLLKILSAWYECLHDVNLQNFLKENERKEYEIVKNIVKSHE